MKLAIMQPYFIPYIGYFQLIYNVDKLVILDDVNYIKRGWINRNRLCVNSSAYWITVPVVNASQNRKINEHDINISERWRIRHLETLRHAYKRAPFYIEANNLMVRLLSFGSQNLSQFVTESVKQVCGYLEINAGIEISSQCYPELSHLSGQEKIAGICEQAGADVYVNLPGGEALYDRQYFKSRNIDIRFMKAKLDSIGLVGGCDGVMNLSIVDMLMMNSVGDMQFGLRQFVEY